MSNIKVDNIIDKFGDGSAPTFTFGASIPSDKTLTSSGNINLSGISTVGFLTATTANIVGVITATYFYGDGSGLTNLPSVSTAKMRIIREIMGSHPFRA